MRGLKLLASLVRETPDISLWSWATVTDDSPLRVQLDGEDAPLAITPDTLITGLSVDDRVWVQLVTNPNPARTYRRLVVLGKASGGFTFPIGHIYMSTSSTDPGTLFGGTWTRIQDKFLMAAGSTYAAASTGGAATSSALIAHTHTGPSHVHSGPSHSHNVGRDFDGGGGSSTYTVHSSGVSGAGGTSPTSSAGTGDTGAAGTGATGSAGSGSSFSILPPYVAVYVWERTA